MFPQFTNVNGTLFFQWRDEQHGKELWTTNGTPQGTSVVEDLNPGAAGSNATSLINANGTLFFWADDGVSGLVPWTYRPSTPLAPVQLADIGVGDPSNPSEFTRVGDTTFFTASDAAHGGELWKTDIRRSDFAGQRHLAGHRLVEPS